MPLHQVRHDDFEIFKGDLFVSIFIELFHGVIDISIRYILIAFLFLEKRLHLVVANVPVSIFVVVVKRLLDVVFIDEDVEIDATH